MDTAEDEQSIGITRSFSFAMPTTQSLTHYANLPTEQANPATENLDELSTLALLQAINQEDQTVVAFAVEKPPHKLPPW